MATKFTYNEALEHVTKNGPTNFWVSGHEMNVQCCLFQGKLADYNGLPMPTWADYSIAPEQQDPEEAPLGISADAFQAQTILEYVEECRTKWGSEFFLHGGCYIFARILQVKFGGVIYDNVDHCVLNKDSIYYDITGIVAQNHEQPYSLIDEAVEARYMAYNNFNH